MGTTEGLGSRGAFGSPALWVSINVGDRYERIEYEGCKAKDEKEVASTSIDPVAVARASS